MDIDRHTQTWQAVEQWLTNRKSDRIQSLINGSPADERHRGEIRLIDDLLADAREEKVSEPSDGPDH